MSNNSFKVRNSLTLTPQDLSLLVNPEAGDIACDINDSNKIKRYDSSLATWVEVGSLAAAGDLDTLLSQDFEQASLTNFTQTGLILDTVAPLNDTKSAKLVHQAAINQSFKQTIPVDLKFRGIPMTVSLVAKSTASAGNLTILFRDETNNVDLQASQQINATSTAQTFQFGVSIPANCASFSYTITALPEAGSPESVIDDLVIRNYWNGTAVQGQTSYKYNSVESQSIYINSGSSSANVDMTNTVVAENKGTSGIINHSSGSITILKKCNISIDFIATQAAASGDMYPYIKRNGSIYAQNLAARTSFAGSYTETVSANLIAEVGDVFTFGSGGVGINGCRIMVTAEAAVEKTITSTDLVPAKAMSGNASISVPKITEWQSYTPTFQGFGTPTNVSVRWRQNGGSVEVEGKFTVGTPTATTAYFTLPNSYNTSSALPSGTSLVGKCVRFAGASAYEKGITLLTQPSLSYIGFGVDGDSGTTDPSTMLNGNIFSAAGNTFTFFASVPIAGLAANETKTWSATQSVVTTEQDSMVRVDTANGFGSTGTRIRRFSTIRESLGSGINYQDSSVNGASFTVLENGVYSISYNDNAGSQAYFGLSKNAPVGTEWYSLTQDQKLAIGRPADVGNGFTSVSWTGYLVAGDVIRPHGAEVTAAVQNASVSFTIAKQGSVKQVQTVADQKIKIPTSELRFEGASSRGSVATAIVKFDTLAKIRGDAFTVTNTAADGTYVTMKKAGRLTISSSVYFGATATSLGISLNQQTLTASATGPETLSIGGSASGSTLATATTSPVSVQVGDIIRVFASSVPTSNPQTSLNFSFQEQDIAVSVTNVLPQFSESDSSVRVDTANGYGSTGTKIRRFSNVRDNIGTDIEYVDSATNGASFTVKSSGIYHISYSDNFSVTEVVGISKNASSLTTDFQSLPLNERLVMAITSDPNFSQVASTQVYLNAGDVIRAHTQGLSSGITDRTTFTISKVGKPNVTGVDVTPFVQMELESTKYQKKTLTTNITSGNVADLAFNNLEPGKTYRLSVKASGYLENNNWRDVSLNMAHNGANILRLRGGSASTGNGLPWGDGGSVVFTATATTITATFVSANVSGTTYVEANATFAILEELPNHEQTTRWS